MELLIALMAGVTVFLLAMPGPAQQIPSEPWATWQGQTGQARPRRLAGTVIPRLAESLANTRLARDLPMSGVRLTLEQVAARKLLLTAVALVTALLVAMVKPGMLALAALAIAVCAFQGPDLEIARRASLRRAAIQKDLPFFLFTMAVLTEAGLQLLPALDHYCRQSVSALSEELRRTLAEIQLGQTPVMAFLETAQYLEVRDFTLFVGALVQTMEKGTDGLAATLRLHAEAAWDKRRRSAQEMGARASVKLFIPLLLFVLPAILTLAAGPAVYSFATQMMR